MERPLWADLHNHNSVGYGMGSLERSYQIAKGSLLDVYCFTPHGHWHDMPQSDQTVVDHHRRGFERVREAWPRAVELAEREHVPGRFITLFGFEWHSSHFGDYHVLFPHPDVAVMRCESVTELQEAVREKGGVMIPHHVGYRSGWRGANWSSLAADVSPVVDVFSEHGCAMEYEFPFPMLTHSTGGVERSQTVMEQLKRGLVVGVTASTDNHHGHPASYGEGLTGIWAEDVSREGVFDAIRRRHTFATTGERISVMFRVGGAIMGDIVPSSSFGELEFEVEACAALDSVRVVKSPGIVAHHVPLPSPHGPDLDVDGFSVRVSCGWDGLSSKEVTDWVVTVTVSGTGVISDVLPHFAGGDGSVEKVNAVTSTSPNHVCFSTFTSRLNAHPISEVTLRLHGPVKTMVEVKAVATHRDEACGCVLRSPISDLLQRDEWGAISESFSAPKIRLGQAHPLSELRVGGMWLDPSTPQDGDWYLLRVQQRNGHVAWSSPIWVM